MHDSTQLLFDEHTLITKAIDAAIHASSLIGHDDGKYEATVRGLIHFFRQYADQYHRLNDRAQPIFHDLLILKPVLVQLRADLQTLPSIHRQFFVRSFQELSKPY